jgi:hypothetical protein
MKTSSGSKENNPKVNADTRKMREDDMELMWRPIQ